MLATGLGHPPARTLCALPVGRVGGELITGKTADAIAALVAEFDFTDAEHVFDASFLFPQPARFKKACTVPRFA